jgi:hypothetical protein
MKYHVPGLKLMHWRRKERSGIWNSNKPLVGIAICRRTGTGPCSPPIVHPDGPVHFFL